MWPEPSGWLSCKQQRKTERAQVSEVRNSQLAEQIGRCRLTAAATLYMHALLFKGVKGRVLVFLRGRVLLLVFEYTLERQAVCARFFPGDSRKEEGSVGTGSDCSGVWRSSSTSCFICKEVEEDGKGKVVA